MASSSSPSDCSPASLPFSWRLAHGTRASPALEPARGRPTNVIAKSMTTFSRALFGAVLGGTAVSLVAGSAASAAEGSASTSVDIAFLGEVMVLILVGRVLAEIMQRLGQPAVMGPLIGGLLLGPSVLGALWPAAQYALLASNPAQKGAVDAFAQFGVLLL